VTGLGLNRPEPPETTPTGQSMYKFGSLRVQVRLKTTMEYLDPSGQKLFSAKMVNTRLAAVP
jgi:hypothetical protein